VYFYILYISLTLSPRHQRNVMPWTRDKRIGTVCCIHSSCTRMVYCKPMEEAVQQQCSHMRRLASLPSSNKAVGLIGQAAIISAKGISMAYRRHLPILVLRETPWRNFIHLFASCDGEPLTFCEQQEGGHPRTVAILELPRRSLC
jgi:hypothetical protein